MMKHRHDCKLFSAGYTGMGQNTLQRLALGLNLVVVDVRYSANSPNPNWRGYAMKRVLGDRYYHLPRWGNINYRHKCGPEIMILDFDAGLGEFRRTAEVIAETLEADVLFLCTCADYQSCHRRVLNEKIAEQMGKEVQELDWRSAVADLPMPPSY